MAETHGGARPGAGRKPGKLGKDKQKLRDLAKPHAEEMIGKLVAMASDSDAPHAARVSAIKEVLDRGYGKAPQSLTGGDDGPIEIIQMMTDLASDDDEAIPSSG